MLKEPIRIATLPCLLRAFAVRTFEDVCHTSGDGRDVCALACHPGKRAIEIGSHEECHRAQRQSIAGLEI
jgi:hypothetical protein